MKKLNIIFIGIILLLTGCSFNKTNQTSTRVDSPMIDLQSTVISSSNDLFSLEGDWSFIPGKLLQPEEDAPNESITTIKVPMSWEYLSPLPGVEDGIGYGTYRLTIHLHPSDVGKTLGFIVEPIASSYQLWVNDQFVRSAGKVGTEPNSSLPRGKMEYVYFVPNTQELQINLQVANFFQRKGGVWSGIYLGSEQTLQSSLLRNTIRECISIGALFMIGIFYLALSGFYKPERATFFLGLFSIIMAIRMFFLGQMLIVFIFPNIAWTWQVKLEYLLAIACIVTLVQYTYEVYLEQFSRYVLFAIRLWCIFFALIVLATPTLFFTKWIIVHLTMMVLMFLYGLGIVYPKAIKQRALGARTGFVTVLIFLLTLINDSLYYLGLPLSSEEIITLGFFCYLLSQIGVTIQRYVLLKKESDKLATHLAESNLILEKEVEQRTLQLTENYRSNSRFMHNLAHDLKAPIQFIHYQAKQLEKHIEKEGEDYLSTIDQQASYAMKLVENLNDLASLQENGMQYRPKLIPVAEFIRQIYKRTEPMIRGGNLKWSYKPLDQLYESKSLIRIDWYLMERIFDNLSSNARKFTPENGEVAISYLLQENTFEIYFENETDGINNDILEGIFERFFIGNQENSGSGIGLAVSREIVRLHGGEMTASRMKPGWISIHIHLPIITP